MKPEKPKNWVLNRFTSILIKSSFSFLDFYDSGVFVGPIQFMVS